MIHTRPHQQSHHEWVLPAPATRLLDRARRLPARLGAASQRLGGARYRRPAGIAACLALIAAASAVWLGGAAGAARTLAIAAFLVGHLGLLATLTFTSPSFGPLPEGEADALPAIAFRAQTPAVDPF